MRIAKPLIAASLFAAFALGGCYNDHPGHWGDRHHHHHRGDHDRDRDNGY
jgi:hypothetical protein